MQAATSPTRARRPAAVPAVGRARRAAVLGGLAVLMGVVAAVFLGIPPSRAAALPTQVSGPPTSGSPPTTAAPGPTTIAPLGNSLPLPPATPALRTRGGSAHVSPVFAYLSGIGFLIALLIMAARLLATRSGGPDRRADAPGDPGYDPAGPVRSGSQGSASRSS